MFAFVQREQGLFSSHPSFERLQDAHALGILRFFGGRDRSVDPSSITNEGYGCGKTESRALNHYHSPIERGGEVLLSVSGECWSVLEM